MELLIGILGFGFMGRTHLRAYAAAAAAGHRCRVIAVCDADAGALSPAGGPEGNLGAAGAGAALDSSLVSTTTDPQQLLDDPRIGLVSICTPTDTHVDLAIRALRAGKHALVEKPVAIHAGDVRRLAAASAETGKLCIPAMCMRYWPGWDWLREQIASAAMGPVRSAAFQRLGSGPTWSPSFYRDQQRSGGPMFDLHVHDADFVYWCFGMPRSVTTHGSKDHLLTTYRYDSDALVWAEGGWDQAQSAGFTMRYVVNFEAATADFLFGRTPALLVHDANGSHPVALPAGTAYESQAAAVVQAIACGSGSHLRATMADAVAVADLLEAEARSLLSGLSVAPARPHP
jgi:predicted dehydrogenase